MKLRPWLPNLLLLVTSTLAALVIAELILRSKRPDQYRVWPPYMERVFQPAPGLMPGIEGDARFLVNEIGMRASPFPRGDHYRILAIGGSTTECAYLDQDEVWTRLLEEALNEKPRAHGPAAPVWVGNVGRSGLNTRHHGLQVEKLLDQHPSIDLVLMLIGANDFLLRLKQDDDYRPGGEEGARALRRAFSVVPPDSETRRPGLGNTELWRHVRRVWLSMRASDGRTRAQDPSGAVYEKWRRHRESASNIRPALPDLSAALAAYVDDVERIIALARERGVEVVLVTQPSMWRADLPPELRQLLWMGGIGRYQDRPGLEYYSVAALARGLAAYNDSLLGVCERQGVQCIDLAASLPKDTTVFFDDVHFNESGARQVAAILVRDLTTSREGSIPSIAGSPTDGSGRDAFPR